MIFKARPLISSYPKSSVWYVKGVNINYSFKSLERVAANLGAKIEDGDLLVVDNVKGDKRKAFRKTVNGCIIVYAQLHSRNLFLGLQEGRQNEDKKLALIDFFSR